MRGDYKATQEIFHLSASEQKKLVLLNIKSSKTKKTRYLVLSERKFQHKNNITVKKLKKLEALLCDITVFYFQIRVVPYKWKSFKW